MSEVTLWASGSAAVGGLAEPIFREGRELNIIGQSLGDCPLAWILFEQAAERERAGYLAIEMERNA
jgi:hypothetical protein